MKKIKYFTHLMLLIAVFALTNCQKEELVFQPDSSKNDLLFHKIKYVYINEINQNSALIKKICDIKSNSLKKDKNSTSKEIYNEDYDFEIDTQIAKYMESIDGSFHSYTFPVIQDYSAGGTMDNLVLYSIDGSGYMAKLVKYSLSANQLAQLEVYDHIDTNLPVEVIDLEGDFTTYLQRGAGDCDYSVQVQHITPSGDTWDFNEGSTCHHQGLGGENDHCDIVVTITVSCGASGASGSGSTGTSTGTTGSGTTTSSGTGTSGNNGSGSSGGSSGGPSGSTTTDGDNTATVIGTAPVPVYYYKKSVINNLDLDGSNLNDANLINWLDNNIEELVEISLLIDEVKHESGGILTQQAKMDIKAAARVISGLEDLNTLATISMNKYFMRIAGGTLESMNSTLFGEHREAWNNIDPNNNLNLGDWIIVSARGFDVYIDYGFSGLDFDQDQAEKDSKFIALLSNVKSLIGEHWPQNAAQWEALGQILLQFMGEIGLAFIPGSDIIGVVQGLDEGDYVAITWGIAGLLVDAFGGTILKVIGKVGKFAYKSFKIFKIVFRYIDEVADIITLGYKVELFEGIVKIIDNANQAIASIQDNVLKLLKNSAKSIIKVADLKLLDNIVPTGQGFISAGKINNKALRIDPQNSDYKSIIDDIRLNGDPTGNKTEQLMQDLLEQDGYEAVINPHLPGNKGFDNVLIKRDASGNITDIIINESKQVSSLGTINLSGNVVGTGGNSLCVNCTQMSLEWIDDVLIRMQNQGGDLSNLADDISNFIDGGNNVTQLLSGVNKNTGELVVLNITGYSTP